jgi:hypothetical protein
MKRLMFVAISVAVMATPGVSLEKWGGPSEMPEKVRNFLDKMTGTWNHDGAVKGQGELKWDSGKGSLIGTGWEKEGDFTATWSELWHWDTTSEDGVIASWNFSTSYGFAHGQMQGNIVSDTTMEGQKIAVRAGKTVQAKWRIEFQDRDHYTWKETDVIVGGEKQPGETFVFARDTEADQNRFIWIIEEDVTPERMDAYMQARVKEAKLSAEHQFEFPFITYTDGFRVTTCGVFRSFSQLNSMPQKMEAWNEKTGGKSKQLNNRIAKCLNQGSRISVAVFRPDLSYEPENRAFRPDFSVPFYHQVKIHYIKPGKYEEIQALARKFKDLHEKKQTSQGFRIYEHIIGDNVPALAVVVSAADAISSAKLEQEEQGKLEGENAGLLEELLPLITRTEKKEGTFVPEASYVPAGTF